MVCSKSYSLRGRWSLIWEAITFYITLSNSLCFKFILNVIPFIYKNDDDYNGDEINFLK